MGQKVHPIGIRLGIVKEHNSIWYANPKTYASNLLTDLEVRDFVMKKHLVECRLKESARPP